MPDLFYIGDTQICSFSDLIKMLNATSNVIQNQYRFNELDFFVNLLAGIASNIDMTLIDNDFSQEEIIKITGTEYKENIVKIAPLNIDNIDSLIDKISKSNSRLIMFTSGTTGVPKSIEHSIESLTRNIKIDTKFLNNVWGFAYNPTHMAGIQVFFQAFFNKNTIVKIFEFQKHEIFERIGKFEISHISATPTFYRLLIPSERKYTSVKQITFGGEKSDNILYSKVSEIFPEAKIRNVYASTEAGALFSSRSDGFVIPDSIKNKIEIKNGELLIHKSLLGKAEFSENENPWYASGDLVEYVDENQLVFRFLARKSEMINVGGYKVNPNEVEAILRNMKGVKEVKVYGLPNSILGNILCADIVKLDDSIKESSIKNYLSLTLQNYKIPRKIYFKDKIILSRTGKIERKNDDK